MTTSYASEIVLQTYLLIYTLTYTQINYLHIKNSKENVQNT